MIYSKDFLDWATSKIPEDWTNAWLAVDSDGSAWLYSEIPYRKNIVFAISRYYYFRIATLTWLSHRWKESLFQLR